MNTTAQTLAQYQMYIEGEWVDAVAGKTLKSDNPFLGKPWALIPRGDAADADRAVQAARKAFTSGEWSKCHQTGCVVT
jgi:(Z)-2-((N-methylformamido)methylene)-5-hydroxybutyrolactone dehydrogenase